MKRCGLILSVLLAGSEFIGRAAVVPFATEATRMAAAASPSPENPSDQNLLRYDSFAQQTMVNDPALAGEETGFRPFDTFAPFDPAAASLDEKVSWLPISATKIPEPATVLTGLACIAIACWECWRLQRRALRRS